MAILTVPIAAEPVLALVAAGVVIGIAVGCTGIGGILLVPVLVYAFGMPVRAAIAVALWSYLLSGGVAVLLYGRRGSIPWRAAWWLCAAAMPGAWLGARTAGLVPPAALEALIAALLLATGVNALRGSHAAAPGASLGPAALSALGAGTGFGAALLGAGGAVLLMPVLLALRQPVLPAIGLGMAIQLPIAAVASLDNLAAGRLDIRAGTIVAVALAVGLVIGTPVAHALPQAALRRLLGTVMLLLGATILGRLALSL